MLTRAENKLVTEVGPGTPMGELMRHYWVPALLSGGRYPSQTARRSR